MIYGMATPTILAAAGSSDAPRAIPAPTPPTSTLPVPTLDPDPLPPMPVGRPPGRWGQLVIELLAAESAGQLLIKDFRPALSPGDQATLRSAAKWRSRAVHIKNSPLLTQVWLGSRINALRRRRIVAKKIKS